MGSICLLSGSLEKDKDNRWERGVAISRVISQKDDVKEKFHKLRKSIEKGESAFYTKDWYRMQQLLEKLFSLL